jgi:hypothetical protein
MSPITNFTNEKTIRHRGHPLPMFSHSLPQVPNKALSQATTELAQRFLQWGEAREDEKIQRRKESPTTHLG